MNQLLEHDFFQSCKKSLAESSIDNHDKDNTIQMIDESFEWYCDSVIDFDDVKTKYCSQFRKSNEVFKSADCLFYNSTSNKLTFVEFKNGKVKDIKSKLKDSLLIFTNIIKQDLEFCRNNCEYIVVYNYEKNKSYVDQEFKSSSIPEGYKEFTDIMSNLAKEEIILWGLDLMKNICVANVHTYDVEQFKVYYQKNISS